MERHHHLNINSNSNVSLMFEEGFAITPKFRKAMKKNFDFNKTNVENNKNLTRQQKIKEIEHMKKLNDEFLNQKDLKYLINRGENSLGGYYITLFYRPDILRSGTWKIIKVEPTTKMLRRDCPEQINENRVNSCLQYGDRVELINMYNQYNGFLHYRDFTYNGKTQKGLVTLQHPFYNRDNLNGWMLAKYDKTKESKIYEAGEIKSGDKICLVCITENGKYVVAIDSEHTIFEGFPILKLVPLTEITKNNVLIINDDSPPPYVE